MHGRQLRRAYVSGVVAAAAGCSLAAWLGLEPLALTLLCALVATVALVALKVIGRLDVVHTRVRNVTQQLSGATAELERLSDATAGVVAGVEDVERSVRRQQELIADLLSMTAGYRTELAEVASRLSALEKLGQDAGAEVTKTAEAVAELGAASASRDTSTFGELQAVQASLAKASKSIGTVDTRLSQHLLRDRRVLERTQMIFRQVRSLPSEVQAIGQLTGWLPTEHRLPTIGGWAVDAATLAWTTDAVLHGGVRNVVEMGSGTSTLWIARALAARGEGRLVAYEHQEEFLEKTRAILQAHGVEQWVDLRLAPLTAVSTERGEYPWYGAMTDDLEPIDMLLVDGPPGNTGPHARYPAIPVLAHKLAPGALVVVDDVSRKDEQEMVDMWLSEQPRLRRRETLGGNTELLVWGD